MSCPCLPGLLPVLSCPTMRMYLIPLPHYPACNEINYKLKNIHLCLNLFIPQYVLLICLFK